MSKEAAINIVDLALEEHDGGERHPAEDPVQRMKP